MQTTRRYPRTLEEAFGPGHRGNISEPYTPMDKADKIVVVACCLIGAAFVALMISGVI